MWLSLVIYRIRLIQIIQVTKINNQALTEKNKIFVGIVNNSYNDIFRKKQTFKNNYILNDLFYKTTDS